MISRIKEALYSGNIHFLMFRGGGGGDTLAHLIYKYSDLYSKSNLPIFRSEINNTLSVVYPTLLQKFLDSSPLDQTPAEQRIFDEALKHNDPHSLVTNLENFLKTPQLVRCHKHHNSFFKNKTTVQYLNEQRWFDYACMLAQLKTSNIAAHDLAQRIDYIYARNEIVNPTDPGQLQIYLDVINSQAKEKLSSFIFCRVLADHDLMSTTTLSELLELSDIEIFLRFKNQLNITWQEHRWWVRNSDYEFYNFSDGFTSNVLEDKFQIVGTQFKTELLEWHERNLELLTSHGIDCAQFHF